MTSMDEATVRVLLAQAGLNPPDPVVLELAAAYPVLRRMVQTVSRSRAMTDEPAVTFQVHGDR